MKRVTSASRVESDLLIATHSSEEGGAISSLTRSGSFTFGDRAGFGVTSQKSKTCRSVER
jgi:hypothetical protein